MYLSIIFLFFLNLLVSQLIIGFFLGRQNITGFYSFYDCRIRFTLQNICTLVKQIFQVGILVRFILSFWFHEINMLQGQKFNFNFSLNYEKQTNVTLTFILTHNGFAFCKGFFLHCLDQSIFCFLAKKLVYPTN